MWLKGSVSYNEAFLRSSFFEVQSWSEAVMRLCWSNVVYSFQWLTRYDIPEKNMFLLCQIWTISNSIFYINS